MSDTAQITVTLPQALQQALVERAQRTGSSPSQVVIQALEVLLTPASASLSDLQARVEHLETQMQTLLAAAATPSVSPCGVPAAALAPTASPTPTPQDTNPHLWDPVKHSFEDWLFQIWQHLSVQQTGQAQPWSHPIPVEELHQLAFYELRYRRFIDRLLNAEVLGLRLLPDQTSQLGLGDCRPGAITFDEIQGIEASSGADPCDGVDFGPDQPTLGSHSFSTSLFTSQDVLDGWDLANRES